MTDSPPTGIERLGGDAVGDPAKLDEMERRLWRDLWDTAVPDAVVEQRIEVRAYGPVEAMLVAALPAEPRFNFLLGAARSPAVAHGHLADASRALRAMGIDHHVPVTPGLEESVAAESWLVENGYRPRHRRARFVRGVAPPGFPEPAGIEVDELTDHEVEGECFSSLIAEAFGANTSLATFFFELPGKAGWRCYAAIDGDEAVLACGAMRVEDGIALFALDATEGDAGRDDCRLALLRRRIVDAAAAGCHTLFADTEESLEEDAALSAAARDLTLAGFARVSLGTVWSCGDPSREP